MVNEDSLSCDTVTEEEDSRSAVIKKYIFKELSKHKHSPGSYEEAEKVLGMESK